MPFLQVRGKNIVLMGQARTDQVTNFHKCIMVIPDIQAVSRDLTSAKRVGVCSTKVREDVLGGSARGHIMGLHTLLALWKGRLDPSVLTFIREQFTGNR